MLSQEVLQGHRSCRVSACVHSAVLQSISIPVLVYTFSFLLLAVKFAERIGMGGPLSTAEERCCVKDVGGAEPCRRALGRYL